MTAPLDLCICQHYRAGCWEWVGARDRFGYGIVARDYFGVGRAHRAVYLRRRCRECNRAAQRRRDAKRKAAA